MPHPLPGHDTPKPFSVTPNFCEEIHSILKQIVDSTLEKVGVVLCETEDVIALVTDKTADCSCRVAMVNDQFFIQVAARCAAIILLTHHADVIRDRHAVPFPKVLIAFLQAAYRIIANQGPKSVALHTVGIPRRAF